MSEKILVGNRKVNVAEVLRVCCVVEEKHQHAEPSGTRVVLDQAVLGRFGANPEAVAEGLLNSETLPELATVEEGQELSTQETRAVLLGKLISLSHKPAPHDKPALFISSSNILQLLQELLNQKTTPTLPKGSDSTILTALASSLVDGVCFHNDEVVGLQQALESCNSEVSILEGITQSDHKILCSGLSASAGISAYHIAAARTLLDAADSVAGLSCEAFGARIEALDPREFGQQKRNHKGMETSANNLENLLRDSKCVATSADASIDDSAYANIPQYHGPAREIIDVARRVIQVELNAKPSGQKPLPHGLMISLNNLSRALILIAVNCRDRIQCFLTKNPPDDKKSESGDVAQEITDALLSQLKSFAQTPMEHALLLGEVVQKTNILLRLELSLVLRNLCDKETSKRQESEKEYLRKKMVREERDQLDQEKLAKSGKKLNEKQLKKQAKKREKIATSALEKRDKQAKLPLGVGTKKLYDSLVTELPLLDTESETLLEDLTSNRSVLDVYNSTVGKWLTGVIDSSQALRAPRVAKGTRDTSPEQMVIREKAFSIITDVFKRHGAQAIDTPVFELKEILMGKYGDDSKLIFDLADQGGDALCLRYDLTVPFARYVGMVRPGPIKRYHIARVYRRDQPVVTKGRFREFYQCDYDIAGTYDRMMPDADVLAVVCEILNSLDLGGFIVKVNHRKLLNAVMSVSGVPSAKFKTVCSSIDKLDKLTPEEVGEELISEKGIAKEVADKILNFVKEKGEPFELLSRLRSEFRDLAESEEGKVALDDLELMFRFLDCMGCLQHMSFDLSLARGLDYYTGPIFEAVLTQHGGGSIAGGGRYDELIGMFSNTSVPAVGVSVGIARILAILESAEEEKQDTRKNYTEVVVGSFGKNMTQERMKLCAELWKNGINAEFVYKMNPQPKNQLEFALNMGCPFLIILDQERVQTNVVELKDVLNSTKQIVPRDELIPLLKSLLRKGPMF